MQLYNFPSSFSFPVPGLDQPDSSEDSAAYRTEDDIEIPANAGPSQGEIVMATEQITKKIQELLQSAQGGRSSRYVYV